MPLRPNTAVEAPIESESVHKAENVLPPILFTNKTTTFSRLIVCHLPRNYVKSQEFERSNIGFKAGAYHELGYHIGDQMTQVSVQEHWKYESVNFEVVLHFIWILFNRKCGLNNNITIKEI